MKKFFKISLILGLTAFVQTSCSIGINTDSNSNPTTTATKTATATAAISPTISPDTVTPVPTPTATKSIVKAIKYKKYVNARFGYSIDYPSTFTNKIGLPENGDGISLSSTDNEAVLTIYGSNNVLNETAKASYNKILKQDLNISYKVLKDNWFVVSGAEDGTIFYKKSVIGTASINTFVFEYPESKEKYYNAVVNRMVKSFKTPSIETSH